MNQTVKVLTGFLAGSLLGMLAGLLLAPTTGKQARKKLGKKSKKLAKKLAHYIGMEEKLKASSPKPATTRRKMARRGERFVRLLSQSSGANRHGESGVQDRVGFTRSSDARDLEPCAVPEARDRMAIA